MAALSRRGAGRARPAWPLFAAAAALLAAFVAIALSAGPGSELASWDGRATEALLARRSGLWNWVLWAITLVGNAPMLGVLTATSAIALVVWGRRAQAALMAGGMLVAQGISSLTKTVIGRPRPAESLALVAQADSDSMPSGHAVLTIVLVGLLVFAVFRVIEDRRAAQDSRVTGGAGVTGVVSAWTVVAKVAVAASSAALVLAVGFSRMYLGVHWASDVVGGWGLGAAWLCAALGGFVVWEGDRPSRSRLRDPGLLWSRRMRLVVLVVLLLLVALVTALTVWSDPLL